MLNPKRTITIMPTIFCGLPSLIIYKKNSRQIEGKANAESTLLLIPIKNYPK